MEMVKSKERVKSYGEVFTPDSIVNDMLDMVDRDTDKSLLWEYIDKTYLEPSCGNGNFLIRILDRKFEIVQKLDKNYWNLGLIRAVSSLYGIDIQADNIEQSKERILNLIKNGYVDVMELDNKTKRGFSFRGFEISKDIERVISYILDLNIQLGNTLTGKKVLDGKDTSEELIITEYNWDKDNVIRKEYIFNNLLPNNNITYNIPNCEYKVVKYLDINKDNSKIDENGEDEFEFE